MRWLLATSVLLLAAPVHSQDKDAEKIYRDMEKKVREAKSLRVVWEADINLGPGIGGSVKIKGVSQLAEGNKARVEAEAVEVKGKEKDKGGSKMLMVSDGKEMAARSSGGPGPQAEEKMPTPAGFNKALAILFARCGLQRPMTLDVAKLGGLKDFDKEFDKLLTVSDFKMGEKERVGNVAAQVIEYATTHGGTEKVTVKLWIDPKTALPIKRRLASEQNKGGMVLSEVYTEFTLDPQMDVKLFELPK